MAKILIMDDEPSLRNILATTVSSMGHTVITAEDGKQAIELARKENPEAALLDFQVPDMDGLEVLKEVKNINPAIKCIMLSGSADVELAVTAMKKGASNLLGKPFKLDEIKDVVTKVLQMKSAVIPTLSKENIQAPKPQPVQEQKQQQTAEHSPASFAPGSAAAQHAAAVQKTKTNKFNPKFIYIGVGVAVSLILAVILVKSLFLSPTIKEFSIPYKNPSGMCYFNSNLWVTDWIAGNIYKHKIDDKLSIDSVFKTANSQPSGISYSGESIWTCNSVEQRIYKHAVDQALTVQAIYATPGSNPISIYFDGANLWALDSNTAKIYKHKMDESLSVISAYDSPAPNPCGMFKNGDFFYIGDYKTSKIYKVSVKDFTVSEVLVIEHFANLSYKLSGITWDGKNIWACADENSSIFSLPIKKLKPVKL